MTVVANKAAVQFGSWHRSNLPSVHLSVSSRKKMTAQLTH